MDTQISDLIPSDLEHLPTDELRSALTRGIEITARAVTGLAAIWMELERRGEDLSDLRSGIAAYLPAIASGRLAPEAVVRLAGNKLALGGLMTLTMPEQQKVLASGKIPVRRDAGVVDVEIHRLSAADVGRAFDRVSGTVIPPDQQLVLKRRTARSNRNRILAIPLTDAEHRALLSAAAKAGKPAAMLVRQILDREGLLE